MTDGNGPFLWLSKEAPPHGYRHMPESGMCVSAFVFLTRPDGKLLLGKYKEHPEWERLAGLDKERQRVHGQGWTVPASQLKFGEDPRSAGKRIVEEMLLMRGVTLGEPRVETDHYVPVRFPELGMHYDIWFFFEARLPGGTAVERPPWFEALEWHDPSVLRRDMFGRSHEDVVARWLARR